jgi:hypothetical protein
MNPRFEGGHETHPYENMVFVGAIPCGRPRQNNNMEPELLEPATLRLPWGAQSKRHDQLEPRSD